MCVCVCVCVCVRVPVPVAERSKARVCGRSRAGIAGFESRRGHGWLYVVSVMYFR